MRVSEAMERAHEIHEATEGHQHVNRTASRIAVLISMLAAALALAQMAEKSSQNAYMTHHIAVSDDWSFYQAKNVRSVMRGTEAAILESLPSATDPAVQARIKDARDDAARLRDEPGNDGMKQIAVQARQEEQARETAFHRYHGFELVVGALEIAIVLASVSIVTRLSAFAIGAATIGLAAMGGGLAIVAGLV
jgi:hypothetical protein